MNLGENRLVGSQGMVCVVRNAGFEDFSDRDICEAEGRVLRCAETALTDLQGVLVALNVRESLSDKVKYRVIGRRIIVMISNISVKLLY